MKWYMSFEQFLQRFNSVSYASKSYTPSDRVALIVEPRGDHPYLTAVIRNVVACLDGSWSVQLWTGKIFITTLRKQLKDLGERLEIVPMVMPTMTRNVYNVLLMSSAFWESIAAKYEHVLLFQTDCVFFRKFDDRWLEYDYVGANYYNQKDVSIISGGVQGGLSYRRSSVMLECVRKVTKEEVNLYRQMHQRDPIMNMMEDVYFTHACEMLGKKMPPITIRPKFAIEADFDLKTFGHHGWNKPYFTQTQRELLIDHAEV